MLVETGVDAVSFGGTKQGLLCGEPVLYLRPGLGGEFPYWQKHAMQLASKMRFVLAQFEALLEGDLWLENGQHANALAQVLHRAVAPLPGVEVVFPVQANSVFARIPPERIAPLQRATFFWPWDEAAGLVRWMCAWDTASPPSHSARWRRRRSKLSTTGPSTSRTTGGPSRPSVCWWRPAKPT